MATKAQVANILGRARQILATPAHWTQDAMARDAAGNPVHPQSPAAVCWCIGGALSRAAAELAGPGGTVDLEALAQAEGRAEGDLRGWWPGGIAIWNDRPEREWLEVVGTLERAAVVAARGK